MPADNRTVRKRRLDRPRARRRVCRVVFSPDASARGRVVELSDQPVTFGRTVDGAGAVDDPTLSRSHFRIVPEVGAQHTIEDLGTQNGTFLDGHALDGQAGLSPQQVIAAGETLFVVDAEPKKESLPASTVDTDGLGHVVGVSLVAERLRRSLATVAPAPGAVLLLGPTGAGKEVAASAIHARSDRDGPLVAVNCAAIPKDMAESELFGHVKGAFTGAESDREGYLERAHGGTLFLDEIGDLPEAMQAKLLRVIETGHLTRLGESSSRTVDVRFIGATHKDLEGGAFRKDLFARLSDWVLRIPSLAQRRADVLPLFERFYGARVEAPEVAEALLLHDWPMNVREVVKLAGRLKTLVGDDDLRLDDLPQTLQDRLAHRFADEASPVPDPDDPSIAAPPRDVLVAALARSSGNVTDAAEANGWHRTQLYRWLKRRGVNPKAYRDG